MSLIRKGDFQLIRSIYNEPPELVGEAHAWDGLQDEYRVEVDGKTGSKGCEWDRWIEWYESRLIG